MKQPKTQIDVRRFVGLVNFYRDLYPKHAKILAPLTNLCRHKTKFVWSDIHEQAFQHMKQLMAQDTMITYPQFEKPFLIHTDASNKQTCGVVMQDNCPLGFFSKKLTDTQQRYPVTKHEL